MISNSMMMTMPEALETAQECVKKRGLTTYVLRLGDGFYTVSVFPAKDPRSLVCVYWGEGR